MEVCEARPPVEAAEDVQARLVHHARVVRAHARARGRLDAGPMRTGDVELEQVVEVLAVLLGVATKVKDAVAADHRLGSRPCRGSTTRNRLQAEPSPIAHIVAVDVILPGIFVCASHQVEAMVPDDDSVPCPGRVHLAQLHLDLLPGPQVLGHVHGRLPARVPDGALAVDRAALRAAARAHRLRADWGPAGAAPALTLQAGLAANQLGLGPQEDSIDVVQATPVEAAEDVHQAVVDNRLVEGACRRLKGRRVHLRPHAVGEVVLVEVWESILRLVNAAEGEHCIAAYHRCVAIACPRSCAVRGQLDPHIRRDVVLHEFLHGIVPVPTSEDVHGVPVDDGGVPETAPGCGAARGIHVAPTAVSQMQLAEVVEPVVPVEAAENQHGVPEEHH
mmetsp:Transcript_117160/g.373175  ORF Transcript_117160/g.373175 Transcript_117160/m.373175 type:complete len:390 (-) Transcript_117160:445-1614(-)